jgi:hypothetical protein
MVSISEKQRGDSLMKMNKRLLAFVAGLLFCVVLVWFSASIWGGEEIYEVRPQISIPEYRTDAARAIDAYERLMERHMDLTEGNLVGIGADVQSAIRKLDSIDGKLRRLSTRITRIEKALGIEQVKPPAKKKARPEDAHGKPPEKYLRPGGR